MFKNNKYYHTYVKIIEKAQSESRIKSKRQYYESHHIIPKSMGGKDINLNLVLLTAREHYICHLLLPRFVKKNNVYKMISALARFFKIANNSKSYSLYKITMRKYSSGEYNHAYGKIWCYCKDTQEILFLKKEKFNENTHIKGLPHQRGGYKDYIWINKNEIRKAVPENQIDEFLLNGWHIGRNVILTKENQNKMFEGRTKESFKSQGEKMKNKVEMTNYIEIKKVNKNDIQNYLDNGYILVKGSEIKRKHKRRCIINNIEYNSVLEATRKTGYTYANIKSKLLSEDNNWNYIN